MDKEPVPVGSARDHLANERTLLAWVRTGTGLLSVGIVVERAGALTSDGGGSSETFGVALALLGCLTLVLGTAQFLRVRREISSGRFASGTTAILTVAAGSLAIAAIFVAFVIGG